MDETNQSQLFDNRYSLVRLIGRGGFSEVWLATDTLTNLEEVIKIYAPGAGMDDNGASMFIKELSVVHNLRHQNLLAPRGMGQFERQPYLILPYCPNGSLVAKVGECSEGELWQILEQVSAGLGYLHKQGIVHQDIKPDNILIDGNGVYVITDFGISLRAQSALRKSMRMQANSGTMAYMAPERFSKDPLPTPENDIWSLGAMMFELLTGDVPFVSQLGGLAQLNGAEMPIIHEHVSDELKHVITSMLEKDMTIRPTAEQLVAIATVRGKEEKPNVSQLQGGRETAVLTNGQRPVVETVHVDSVQQPQQPTNTQHTVLDPAPTQQGSNNEKKNPKKRRMFSKPLSFKGRVRRLEFVLSGVIGSVLCLFIFSFVSKLLNDGEVGDDLFAYLLGVISYCLLLWFYLAVRCKRCHDIGKSGWYQLIPFYVFVLIFVEGQKEPNKYGPPSKK